MSTLNELVAKRVGKLFRLLASDFDGEVLGAARRMKQTLSAEGLSLNDIAIVIENAKGAIEELRYSEGDVEKIFRRGVEKGRAEEARKQQGPPDFYDADGRPRWHAIALFCQQPQQHTRLRPKEQEFVDDMAGRTMWHEPTARQAKWLLSIFIRLGGRRQ